MGVAPVFQIILRPVVAVPVVAVPVVVVVTVKAVVAAVAAKVIPVLEIFLTIMRPMQILK